ncbi:DMT family transporter [Terasakiella sp. A23]|uniref:DMT family transporter n=1 Tax=Terasakiella sp. FCG-A23 TaxID=3080561 RepID=UPI002952C29B|nr:DMT family transporter [Terasakiella sp. A23]MDV7340731.1 DMT family transporter [Terasakiella sp. A23]
MSDQHTSDPTAIIFVFLATVALAFKGVFAKFAYLADMSVDALLLLRFGIAAPLFWVGVYVLARKSASLSWAQWKACSFAGLMFFFATYCDFTAISKIGVSVSRLILFTFPMIVMLINAVLSKRMPSLHQWIVFAVTYFGILLVMAPTGMDALDGFDWNGAAWALGSAVTYAVYLVSSQEIMKSIGSVRFTAASGTITLAVMLAVIPISAASGSLIFPTDGVFWGALIAIFCTVLPFFMLFEGIKRCGATQASLITLSGPILTVIAAWLILDETLSSIQIVGAVITIAGVSSLKAAWLVNSIRKIFSREKMLKSF